MANCITCVRIVCGIALLFCPVFSPAFYALYLIAGVSDMADGAVARKTGTVSAFGSKLDTAADFVLVAVCLIKLIPVLPIPAWLLIWIIVIAAIKAINLISGFVMRKKLVVLHTVMNKVTGMSLFALPLTLTVIDLKYSGAIVCAAATLAAVQEGHLIRTGTEHPAPGKGSESESEKAMKEDRKNITGAARRGDWKTKPMPEQHAAFVLDRSFSDAEMAALRLGNVPQAMEDKWFWYMEGATLWAHRSWTGYCIYRIDFGEDGHHAVTVNRDPEQYGCTSIEEDAASLNKLLDWWTQTPYAYDQAWLSETYDALRKAGRG